MAISARKPLTYTRPVLSTPMIPVPPSREAFSSRHWHNPLTTSVCRRPEAPLFAVRRRRRARWRPEASRHTGREGEGGTEKSCGARGRRHDVTRPGYPGSPRGGATSESVRGEGFSRAHAPRHPVSVIEVPAKRASVQDFPQPQPSHPRARASRLSWQHCGGDRVSLRNAGHSSLQLRDAREDRPAVSTSRACANLSSRSSLPRWVEAPGRISAVPAVSALPHSPRTTAAPAGQAQGGSPALCCFSAFFTCPSRGHAEHRWPEAPAAELLYELRAQDPRVWQVLLQLW